MDLSVSGGQALRPAGGGRAQGRRRSRDAWLAGQNEAFKAAINGAPLEQSLGILISTAIEQMEGKARCAFVIANDEGTELRHLVGMPDAYARHIEGFRIGPDSLACGLAVGMAMPVITPDVHKEPRWKPWVWLADQFHFRGVWSFPVEISCGRLVGSFAMYFEEPRKPTPRDLALARTLTGTGSIIIANHLARVEAETELSDTKRLQTISTELIQEENIEALYEKILDAVTAIMHSEFAGLQILVPHPIKGGALKLLAARGFDAEAAEHWKWVGAESTSACGGAFRNGGRVIIPDIELDEAIAGSKDLATYRRQGIRAVQTTPLVSRNGQLVGMLSSHWRSPRRPPERELRLIDILARQVADLVERAETQRRLKSNEARFRAIAEQAEVGIGILDRDGCILWMNDRKLEIIGRTRDDVIGKSVRELTHPEDWPEMEAHFVRMIESGEPFVAEKRLNRVGGQARWNRLSVSPRRDSDGAIIGGIVIAIDISSRIEAEARQAILLGELQHRVRNTLGVIRSIARRSAEYSDTVNELAANLDGRIGAFARVQATVTRDPNTGVNLASLVSDELSAVAGQGMDRITIDGPPVRLAPKAAETFALAIHELATNALKYGALGPGGGSIKIRWKKEMPEDCPSILFGWTEKSSGTSPPGPRRSGFGTDLIEGMLAYQLGAEAKLKRTSSGIRCLIRLPTPDDRPSTADPM